MHTIAIAAILTLLLAACGSPAIEGSPADTAEATTSSTATPQTTASPEDEETPTPTRSPEPTATPAADRDPFAETDTCINREDDWTVEFPESWWTNTEFTHSSGEEVAACWMFSADEFDATDARNPNQPASGADIYLQLVPPEGLVGVSGEVVSEEEITVDGYDARRIEWRGTDSGTTEMGEDDRLLQYVVQLPDDVEFTAFADSTRTSDYDQSVEVLDGMMERIDLGNR